MTCFFAYYAVVTEPRFLTAITIRTMPTMAEIPPMTGRATSKPQDNRKPPNNCEWKTKQKSNDVMWHCS